ncbi:MAG: hypothetical protein Q4Q00_04270 [Turicibacter sp.]|nr:hypothetical protein [Turicibacter sp.]
MRQNGAPFSKIIQFDNQDYYFKQNNQLFTLEIYVTGIEEREFTKANCMSLAKLCGKLHRISEDINFNSDTMVLGRLILKRIIVMMRFLKKSNTLLR